jgi:hypothetical protein
MLRLRRLISTATLSNGGDSTLANTEGRAGQVAGGAVRFSQRIPARSSAAAQAYARTLTGSCATAEIPATRESIPIVPAKVHPPSLLASRASRRRLPPTVVALMRTSRSTPAGYAQMKLGGEPTSRPGRRFSEMVFSCRATGPTGGA